MTGYGRAQKILNGREIAIEIKSVNSRYLEYTSKIPKLYSFTDIAVKKIILEQVSRGKVELICSIQLLDISDTQIQPDMALALQYKEAFSLLSKELSLENDIGVSIFTAFKDVFTIQKTPLDEEMILQDILQVATSAVVQFNAMRQKEGAILKQDLLDKMQNLQVLLNQIEQDTEGRSDAYIKRLYERLVELLEDKNIDQARLVTEAAIFADKTAVDEEIVRLKSHIIQFKEILELTEPIGRKLDFLVQEINREINTIGSKCQDVDITKCIVNMKSELEKIREQLQNIE